MQRKVTCPSMVPWYVPRMKIGISLLIFRLVSSTSFKASTASRHVHHFIFSHINGHTYIGKYSTYGM